MKLRIILMVLSVACLLAIAYTVYFGSGGKAAYPNRPITIVVHSKPGSGIDVMSRFVADIARKKHGVSMVVENKPGTQGIVAMTHVLGQRRDGYTMLGVTKSFLSSVLVNKSDIEMADFDFIANMMQDAEAIIVNKKAPVNSLASIIDDAKAKNGAQVWIGAGTGGRDHLMAIKTWDTLGIKAQWHDYKNAPAAILAMMRQEAPVTVGNPADIDGRDDLALAAIAHSTRLKVRPDAPTFKELGYPLEEYMWRGFAFAKGVPPEAEAYMESLLRKISKEPEFLSYIETEGAFNAFAAGAEFQEQVHNEMKETEEYLEKAGLLQEYTRLAKFSLAAVMALITFALAAVLYGIAAALKKKVTQRVLLPAFLLWVAAVFYYQTTLFILPEGVTIVSPALIPRLWIFLLAIFCVFVIRTEFAAQKAEAPAKTEGDREGGNRLWLFILLVAAYFAAVAFAGFYLSTFVFLILSMFVLYYREPYSMITIAASAVVLCHVVFTTMLDIKLPTGSLF